MPNILLIMTDQQRADFSVAEGFPLDTTPAIDALGTSGVRFGRAYTSCPVCMPARCSLLTGRFPKAHGVHGNHPHDAASLRASKDLPAVLREAGLRLLFTGKNHSHAVPERWDEYRQYGHSFGPLETTAKDAAADAWLTKLVHGVAEKPTPFPVESQHPVRIVNDAIEYLARHRQAPFFLWVSFPEPHNPYQVPAPYFDLFPPEAVPDRYAGPEILKTKNYQWRYELELIHHYDPDADRLWRRYRSNYCGMLRLIDDQVSRLLQTLDEMGLRENTLIIFLSDHGDYAGEYGLFRKGVGMPECLMRIPMVWSGPGMQPGRGLNPAFVSIVDVMPTLCAALGLEIPIGVQGRSLWPLLTGRADGLSGFESIYAEHGFGGRAWGPADAAPFEGPTLVIDHGGGAKSFSELNNVTQSGVRRMVRKGDWKLIFDLDLGHELYDLAADPGELNNLFGRPEQREIENHLFRELAAWSIRTDDVLPPPVGFTLQ